MQSDYRQIYKILSEETGKPEQVYKDIVNFIFRETHRLLHHPPALIIKLKGIGSWHLRKKRMDIFTTEWPHMGLVKSREDFSSDVSYNDYKKNKDLFDMFIAKLEMYEEYIQKRREVREIRHKTQFPLVPKGDEKFKSE